ncbi:MAG: hypothetical protein LBD25_02010 [Coriobacteriales bacterium]|jgi:hypothetical protein|nr:hypothetical protein [Coriobacteriales bacterium]
MEQHKEGPAEHEHKPPAHQHPEDHQSRKDAACLEDHRRGELAFVLPVFTVQLLAAPGGKGSALIRADVFSRGVIRIECNGRVAHFVGELASDGFEAYASSMEWIMSDGTTEIPTEAEKLEVMEAAVAHYKGKAYCIHFVDDDLNELLFNVPVPVEKRAKRKVRRWRR